MSLQSKIEWTDATWNPVRGCLTKARPQSPTLTLPPFVTLPTNGPGRTRRIREIAGNALRNTSAISLPLKFPATRTNTRAPLDLNAAISSGRYRKR